MIGPIHLVAYQRHLLQNNLICILRVLLAHFSGVKIWWHHFKAQIYLIKWIQKCLSYIGVILRSIYNIIMYRLGRNIMFNLFRLLPSMS